MTRRAPVLTPEQYRQRALTLRVEVAEIAWSLVVSPVLAGTARRWRVLTEDQTLDVFDRLMAAVTRHSTSDIARIDGPASRPRRP